MQYYLYFMDHFSKQDQYIKFKWIFSLIKYVVMMNVKMICKQILNIENVASIKIWKIYNFKGV